MRSWESWRVAGSHGRDQKKGQLRRKQCQCSANHEVAMAALVSCSDPLHVRRGSGVLSNSSCHIGLSQSWI